MTVYTDGPQTSLFTPVPINGNLSLTDPESVDLPERMTATLEHAPSGECVCWGIPFEIDKPLVVKDEPVAVSLGGVEARWIVFMHTSDVCLPEANESGFVPAYKGLGALAEHCCDYVVLYGDGTEARTAIRRRHQISSYVMGEFCVEAVGHAKPTPLPGGPSQRIINDMWGTFQTHASPPGARLRWTNYLWAWENPHPDRKISELRIEPLGGVILLFAASCGDLSTTPLQWQSRQKAALTLPEDEAFDPLIDNNGLLKQVQLDMGQVIFAKPRLIYPDDSWAETYNNQLPDAADREILVEYTAHPDASFHFPGGETLSLASVDRNESGGRLVAVPPSDKAVTIRTIDRSSKLPVPVKLHIHGTFGEYLTPVDRHRLPNPSWFQDYAVDYIHRRFTGFAGNTSNQLHHCTYIPGETQIKLPESRIYLEASKGFEYRPVRQVLDIEAGTDEIVVELEKALTWREKGWVTADTHVHFLSPQSAQLEGSCEGVNIVNLLASQWGEMMTNVGDFDGQTTFGSREAGGDGEYLVRVGTENRQCVLGHISLLGYGGNMIVPMCSGGPGESAIGDPLEVLLTEWAAQCKQQGGLVVLPHFPFPRMENAAAIVTGNVDGVEMTSWGDLYSGINAYSLSDWYRYLNCGHMVAAVGGTDKMSAETAVGTVRTYAKIGEEAEFTYGAWMEAVRKANTFVTYGPLMEFAVEGKPPGSRIEMSSSGGTVDVTWEAASVTIPMSRVDLVANGVIVESQTIDPGQDSGSWSIEIDKSTWLALLIRGNYPDHPEVIAAHSSPVMVSVADTSFFQAADAVTILEQIEGSLAFIDKIGTRADAETYKRMRLILTAAHRDFHNRMHQLGYGHHHPPLAE